MDDKEQATKPIDTSQEQVPIAQLPSGPQRSSSTPKGQAQGPSSQGASGGGSSDAKAPVKAGGEERRGSLSSIKAALTAAASRMSTTSSSGESRTSGEARDGSQQSRRNSASPDNDADDDDGDNDRDGAGHDTITSLAGLKMLQRYRHNLTGSSGKGSSSSNAVTNQKKRLENLFLIEEDAKEDVVGSIPAPGGRSKKVSEAKEPDSLSTDLQVIPADQEGQQKGLPKRGKGGSDEARRGQENAVVSLSKAQDGRHREDNSNDDDSGSDDDKDNSDDDVGDIHDEDVFIPPDGGYGWWVALGSFLALFWTAGMVKSYGVVFSRILDEFPGCSVALASWIPGCMTTFTLLTAPVTSALCQRFNCRLVTMAGSLLCFVGVVASSFADSLEALFVTLGVLTGIGMGLSTTPGIILTARYFNSRRGVANSLCLSGTAAGSFCLPFLIEALLEVYEFRGTLLIIGGCMLHILVAAALYRPLPVHAFITNLARRRAKRANKTRYFQVGSRPCRRASMSSHDCGQEVEPLQLEEKCSHNQEDQVPTAHNHHPHHHHRHHHAEDPKGMAEKLASRLAGLQKDGRRLQGKESSDLEKSGCDEPAAGGHQHHRGSRPRRSLLAVDDDKSSSTKVLAAFESGGTTTTTTSAAADVFGGRHSYSMPSNLEFHRGVGHQAGPAAAINSSLLLMSEASSSLASKEDLQCIWQDEHSSSRRASVSHETDPLCLISSVSGAAAEAAADIESSSSVSKNANKDLLLHADLAGNRQRRLPSRALSLREVCMHQIGNRFGHYASLLFHGHHSHHVAASGHHHSSKGSSDTRRRRCRRHNSRRSEGNFCISSMDEATNHSSRRKPTAGEDGNVFFTDPECTCHVEPAAAANISSGGGGRQLPTRAAAAAAVATTAFDSSRHSDKGRVSEKYRRLTLSKLSLMFNMEDLTTDSTSFLKDHRFPDVTTVEGHQGKYISGGGLEEDFLNRTTASHRRRKRGRDQLHRDHDETKDPDQLALLLQHTRDHRPNNKFARSVSTSDAATVRALNRKVGVSLTRHFSQVTGSTDIATQSVFRVAAVEGGQGVGNVKARSSLPDPGYSSMPGSMTWKNSSSVSQPSLAQLEWGPTHQSPTLPSAKRARTTSATSSSSCSRQFRQEMDPEDQGDAVLVEKPGDETLDSMKLSQQDGQGPAAGAVNSKELEQIKAPFRKRIWATTIRYLDVRLCGNLTFILMASTVMSMALGVPHVLVFLPSFLKSAATSVEGDEGLIIDPALLLSITAICDFLGRSLCGFFLDLNWFSKHQVYSFMILTSGISVAILPLVVRSYAGIVTAMVFHGIGIGSWFMMVPLMLIDYLGVEQITSSYGLARFFQALSNLAGPLTIGFLKDATSSFTVAFHLIGGLMCIGAISILFIPFANSYEVAKAERKRLALSTKNGHDPPAVLENGSRRT